MAINPSKLLRLKPIRATISASSLKGSLAPVGPKITASKISSSSIVANKQVVEIQNSLNDIINILKTQNTFLKDTVEKTRKSEEAKRRAGVEENLEKRADSLTKSTEKVLSPVKSLLDKIIDFILAVFIGRSLVKLIRWFSDPQNKTKVRSIFRFLGDHWPKLLALYLRFGTGLGRFIGGLSSLLIRGTLRIAQAAAGLAARAGLKGAGRVAGFLGGKYGKALAVGLEVGTTVAGTMALSKGIENFGGLNEVKTPKFAGGGLATLSKLFRFSGGSFVPGVVSGKKGVDKVPAMLTDGEFVMSRGAVQKYGVNTLEAMNAAGGGTNRPRISSGTTYAAGGGMIGSPPDFWKLAALVSKEDSLHSQGQADVAQTIYNRAAIGTYPGGRSIGNIITASGQFAPTFSNPGSWTAIKDRKSAASAAGNASKVDMAVKSITNPTLQKNARNFVGGRTDFMGESQKKNMKPGDITRGPGFNFHGWFYDARLANPAPVPRMVISQSTMPQQKQEKQKKQPGLFQRFSSGISSMFGLNRESRTPPSRFSGGLSPQSTSRPSAPLTISSSTARSKNASRASVSPPVSFMPEVVYEVMQPTTKSMASGASGVPQVPSFSATYSGGNAIKNATIYGIG